MTNADPLTLRRLWELLLDAPLTPALTAAGGVLAAAAAVVGVLALVVGVASALASYEVLGFGHGPGEHAASALLAMRLGRLTLLLTALVLLCLAVLAVPALAAGSAAAGWCLLAAAAVLWVRRGTTPRSLLLHYLLPGLPLPAPPRDYYLRQIADDLRLLALPERERQTGARLRPLTPTAPPARGETAAVRAAP